MNGRRSIFISGAGRGIGRAVAERFAGAGWHVGVYDIDGEATATVRRALGDERVVAGELDVTVAGSWRRALAHFVRETGRLDVLFNNAGILTTGPFDAVPLSAHERTIDVNVKGVVNGAYEAFGYLRATPGARMISMASASAIYGQPDLAVYSATKFAVRALTEALEIEWRAHDIAVRAVWPLFVDTAMVRENAHVPTMGSLGIRLTADDVAKVVERAAKSRGRRTHWFVGSQTTLTALGAKIAPAALTRATVARLAHRAP